MEHRTTANGLGQQEKLLFLHMPKVGGRSISVMLDQRFGDDILRHKNWSEVVEYRAQLDNFRAFRGHLFAAMAELLKDRPATAAFFRDPVDRAISEYNFIRRTPEHPRHGLLRSQTLEDFVSKPNNLSVYCRFLGYAPHEGDFGRMRQDVPDDELLERCLRRLDEMAFVGITEQFDEHYRYFERWIGADPMPTVPSKNRAPAPSAAPPAHIEEMIRETAWINYRIYEHARSVSTAPMTALLEEPGPA
jgi:hypothetical protein